MRVLSAVAILVSAGALLIALALAIDAALCEPLPAYQTPKCEGCLTLPPSEARACWL